LDCAEVEYAECLLKGDGVEADVELGRKYLRRGVAGKVEEQVKAGIRFLTGDLGRFDFEEAKSLFEEASASNRFAGVLRDSLSLSRVDLVSGVDLSENESIFTVLRWGCDESIPLIRILNGDLCSFPVSDCDQFSEWQRIGRYSLEYLVEVSRSESYSLESHPSSLLMCDSIDEMISIILRMYTIESSLFKNVNHFLRCFPMNIVNKFLGELRGIVRYIYLLQSSIYYCSSRMFPIAASRRVYRGIEEGRSALLPLYESMIGDVIVWCGFTSTSANYDFVIEKFGWRGDSLVFEIEIGAGSCAAEIAGFSEYPSESEILIAASSGFRVESVDFICDGVVPLIKLSYFLDWWDFDLDRRPLPVLVHSDESPPAKQLGVSFCECESDCQSVKLTDPEWIDALTRVSAPLSLDKSVSI
jgi:hypothetical protein